VVIIGTNVQVVTLAEIKLDMMDNKYNSSAAMLRDRMPELNYRYFSASKDSDIAFFLFRYMCDKIG
jgi:hypothetical protein